MTVVAIRGPKPESESDALELIQQARALLEAATSIDVVKDIRDRAEALRGYRKQAECGLEAQNQAAEVKLRAERRAGELLAEMPMNPGSLLRGDTMSPRGEEANLADLGIQKHESSRWQRIASLAEPVFEDYIAETIGARREVTTAGALKLAKQSRPPTIAVVPNIPEGMFSTIVADPPWRYGNTSTRGAAQDHYDTMSIEELCDLGIARDRAAEQSHLYLWSTAGHLPDAFKVMEAWGFTYKTYLVWVKPQMGMGNYFRVSTELVLFGIKGGLRTNDRGLMNYFNAPRGKHSAKPKGFRDLVKKASPGPYLEMFSRCRVSQAELLTGCECSSCEDGWETWGNQA